ncbi:MAG TPA: choice-of-anchor Q domain-containing protein [Candidatus Udaeobacter sp.]|jgi:hypothetical protein|nr:choice-of-anchor Q domain-containing protein [Candidatus Udaeobacter sp.]
MPPNSFALRILICSLLLCVIGRAAQATTITIINTNDSGPGSLRQALAVVNDGDTIDFDSALNGQTITLMSAELLINKSITVMGPGANLLTVARAQNAPEFRIFHVTAGHSVTIQGLTITNGSTNFGFGGAGIYNDHSNLTVNNCVVTANALDHRTNGGGITNNGELSGSASLTLNDSTISGNSVAPGGTATFGGGMYNYAVHGSVTVTISNSTISDNQAFQGGGIFNFGGVPDSVAIITINNSTISGNLAEQYSGGIANLGDEGGQATLIVTNCTFAGNSLSCCEGSAIFNDGNTQPGGATLEIGNAIFKGNVPNQRNILNQGGVVISDGYNLTNDAGVLNTNGGVGGFNAPGDQINTVALLGPLQNNGGPTFTHALLVGSPAIDTGDPNFTPPPFFDQRGPGFVRVVNGRIDKGSFELQAGTTPTPTPTVTPSATATATMTPIMSPTPTATPTSTPRPTPTPRSKPVPRPRPTPAPRPTV